jgi:PAS domain S-box-containing protein
MMTETQQSGDKNMQEQVRELQRQVEEYRLLFDTSPVMFWYKDTKNNSVRVSKSAAEFEGSTVDALEGKSAYDLYPQEQAEAFYKDDLEVINSGKPKLNIIESHTRTGTGETMWLQTGKVPMRDADENIIGVVAFAVDITGQKEAQEKLQEAQDKLQKRQQQVERANELFRSTVDQLMEVLERGVDMDEVKQYLIMARTQFARLDKDT